MGDHAAVEDDEAVGFFGGEREGSGGDYGGFEVKGDGADEFGEFVEEGWRERGIEVFDDEKRGMIDEGSGEGDAKLLIAGEEIDWGESEVSGLGELEELVGADAGIVGFGLGDFEEGHGDIFEDGKGMEEERGGEEKAEMFGAESGSGVVVEVGGGGTEDFDFAGFGEIEERESAKERGNFGGIGGEEEVEKALGEFEGYGEAEAGGAGDRVKVNALMVRWLHCELG